MLGRRAGSTVSVYAQVHCREPKTGQQKVQLHCEDEIHWRSGYSLSMIPGKGNQSDTMVRAVFHNSNLSILSVKSKKFCSKRWMLENHRDGMKKRWLVNFIWTYKIVRGPPVSVRGAPSLCEGFQKAFLKKFLNCVLELNSKTNYRFDSSLVGFWDYSPGSSLASLRKDMV